MKNINIILILMVSFMLNGCYIGPATYEIFEQTVNLNAYHIFNPKTTKLEREIYDKDKYIYITRDYPFAPGCVFGYLTNRDDKPEKVIGWIIISGKEYCKEQQAYGF